MMEGKQETVEVESCIKQFPWLIQMVKSKLFHELCEEHTTKKRCHFCCDCMTTPLCDLCYKKSDHKHHSTIQTYRSSYKSGVRKETISKYMDTSGIHIYTINSYPIVYINQRRDNNDNHHRHRNNVSRKCQVCEWELDAASSAFFCSIECKFRNTLGSQMDELMMENSEDVTTKRRHRRKGIPFRSPFY